MTHDLGERVWLWRKMTPDRWELTSAVVIKRHRNKTVTVSFQTSNGRWVIRHGAGVPSLDGARISTQAVYREEKEGQKALPVAYERMDV